MKNIDVQEPIVRPRIYSAKKQKLEGVVPLSTPYSVHIDVCSVCNFKCSFCFQADENKYAIIIMSLLVFEFYLQFLGAKAVKDVTPL